MRELESRWISTSASVCPESSWFIMHCVVLSQPLWSRCPSCCFIATGYSIGFGQWYRRYCGICISFPQSPVGQPGAVYLSGYKAASQRAMGKGNGTEVGVEGTGCHCVFQQGCEICKCLKLQLKEALEVKELFVIHISRHTCASVSIHANVEDVHTCQHECKYVYPSASNPSAQPFPTHSPFIFVQPCTILLI